MQNNSCHRVPRCRRPHRPLFPAGGRGFSLLEVIMVALLIGVLSAIAIPRYANSLQRYRADAAAYRIAADVALLQARANHTSTSQTMLFATATNSYQIVGMPDLDNPAVTYTVSLGAGNYQATLVSASFNGTPQMQMDGYGAATSGGTVVISVGSISRTITIDAGSGRATVQ